MCEDETRSGFGRSWFEEQVMSLLPDLLSGALGMADERAEAEDVVAEAVARAWENRNDLRDRGSFRGWLFRILRNCHLSRCRRRASRPEEVPLPQEGDQHASFSLFEELHQPFLLWWGNPEQDFLDRLLAEDLRRAVDSLPEIHRTVVVLADIQGFTYAEIAEILEVPVGTVRSRLSRARSRLQEALWSQAVDAGLRPPRDDEDAADDDPSCSVTSRQGASGEPGAPDRSMKGDASP